MGCLLVMFIMVPLQIKVIGNKLIDNAALKFDDNDVAGAVKQLRWALQLGMGPAIIQKGLHKTLLGLVDKHVAAQVLSGVLDVLQTLVATDAGKQALVDAGVVPVLNNAIADGWLSSGLEDRFCCLATTLTDADDFARYKHEKTFKVT